MPSSRSNFPTIILVVTFLVCISALFSVSASDQETVWIDVRTPAEFASGHVDGALNIEFQLISERIAEVSTNKDTDIRLYCRSGRRSGVANETLQKLGYRNTTNVGGVARALVTFQKQQAEITSTP